MTDVENCKETVRGTVGPWGKGRYDPEVQSLFDVAFLSDKVAEVKHWDTGQVYLVAKSYKKSDRNKWTGGWHMACRLK